MAASPRSFGRYRLERRVGVGGMGEVFAATVVGAEGFERPVAIKVILPDLTDEEGFQKMFVDEAKISMFLQHANIVQVLDLGEVGGRYFLAMEYVEGPNLSRVLKALAKRGKQLPFPLALYVIMEVLKGLDYAHHARDRSGNPLSIVHRDVTPQNVLISMAGEVKISDFGIAKAATKVHRTQTGIVRGKLYYIAPEQLESGQPVGPWTDVYSAGMLLQVMLTGRNPLEGLGEPEVMEKLRALEELAPAGTSSLSPDLAALVAKALQPNHKRRYPSARAFLEALEELVLKNRIKTGARYMAQLLHQIAVDEANERGLPAPPDPFSGLAEPVGTAAPVSATVSTSISLALVMGTLDEPGEAAPSAPQPAPSGGRSPAPSRRTLLWGGAAVLALALAGGGWVLGRWVHELAPVPLPPVASHAPPPDPAAAVGWLYFDPYPWAECSIDGRAVGESPLVGHALAPGSHTLEYRAIDGRQGSATFVIRSGRATVVRPF